MSIQQKPGHTDDKISAGDVDEYLRRHPDFLEDNPDLLACLNISHDTGNAVSLVERQVKVLRKQNKKLNRQFEELVAVARDNDKLGKQVFQFTLALMHAGDAAQIFAQVQESLRRDFLADAVALRLLATPKQSELAGRSEFQPQTDEFSQLFGTVLNAGRPICGRMPVEQKAALFGDVAENVKSMALLPLLYPQTQLPSATQSTTQPATPPATKNVYGLLAIGSFDEQRFQSGMGTLYLEQIGALLGQALLDFVDPVA